MNRLLCAVASLVVMSIGCAHAKPEPAKAAEPAPAAPVARAAAAPVPGCSTDSECKDGQLCIRSSCVDISLGLAECQMFRVQFAFNAADFAPESKDDLARMARCLRADQALRLSIEGNADERGTEEYNLQLGSKRASSVEKYLLALGVTATQVKTVSYGENKPLCSAQDEACWAKNRRASVKPTEAPKAKSK
ncbi:MAG: OmpA family protein [Myxococcaceae bacterium]|nr:OmpA family protein [Myxococcaceae bacterium]